MLFSFLALQLFAGRLDSPVTERAEMIGKQALARGNEPRGAASLIKLHALLDEVDDLNLLAEPFAQLVSRRSTDERVRTLAQLFLADVERARGRTVKAHDLVKDLGFVQDWHVVGSFENEGKSGCDTDFGPEAATDLKATYPTKSHDVGWRKLPARTLDGYVDLSLAVRPSREAVVYALTFLQTEAEVRSELSLGTSGGFRLFVNGVKVASSDRYNQPRADQQRVQVTLRKGMNRVLLKVCQETGQLGFYFRAEREGARGAVTAALPDAVPPFERGSAPNPSKLLNVSEAIAERLRMTPNDAELRADYATVLAFTRAYEEKEHTPAVEAAKAADAKPKDLEVQLNAAILQYDDVNQRRALIERALKASPDSPWARLQLAQHELNREHPDLALTLSTALTKDFPHFAPAHLVSVRALDNLNMDAAATRVAEAAFSKLAFVPGVAREAAAQSRKYDRLSQAIERTRMVLALRYDDVNARRSLAAMLADVGNIGEAVDQYQKVLGLDPFDLQTLMRLADVYAANDNSSAARGLYEQARALAPDEPEVYERAGRALLHASLKDEALLAFSQSLQLRPQNPALKETVRSLRGDEESDVAPYVLPMGPLLEKAKALKGEDAVYLADVNAVRVQASGLASRFNQMVVKVFTERGVDAFRALPITYSPDRQEVRVIKARITKPDGSVVDSFGDQDRTINEPWAAMYYDTRSRVLSFPALAPNDVLEVQWRLDDTSLENLLSDYWGDVEAVQSIYPKSSFSYVVDMPKSRPLYWNVGSLPKWVKSEITSSEKGDRTVYRFHAENVAKVVPEPHMPGWSEIATPLHLSTYKSWQDVSRYWWGLVRDQLTPNDELRKTVADVLKNVDRKDEAKVVAAIYAFVVTNTRYVALEFGIHGYKPYRVDRVLARRFGDCKDKASLIVAMLKVANVDARLVLLRMRNLGSVGAEPASLAPFNHAIAYVPSQKLYIDGTAQFVGSRELPYADRVANVLVVEPDGSSSYQVTPEGLPEESVTTATVEATLKLDGSATAKGSVSSKGSQAWELRRDYQTQATRTSVFEQKFAQSFPGVTASEVTLSDVRQLEQPATLGYSISMPRFAEATGSSLRFYPFGAGRQFTQVLAPLTDRTWDVVLPSVWVDRQLWTYVLPAGWSLAELPADTVESSPFGSLKIHFSRVDSSKVLIEGEMVMSTSRIAAKDYPAFRNWLLRVDQAYSKKVVAQRGAQTASLDPLIPSVESATPSVMRSRRGL